MANTLPSVWFGNDTFAVPNCRGEKTCLEMVLFDPGVEIRRPLQGRTQPGRGIEDAHATTAFPSNHPDWLRKIGVIADERHLIEFVAETIEKHIGRNVDI